MEKPSKYIPDFTELYNKTCEFVKAHQGSKGYIDTQDSKADTIYAFKLEGDMAVEMKVHGVKYDEKTDNLLVVCEHIANTYEIIYSDEDFQSEYCEWESVPYSDIYYVHTLINIAELIHEYVED